MTLSKYFSNSSRSCSLGSSLPPSDDEVTLKELIAVASKATKSASKSLEKGINDAEAVLKELRAVH